MKGGRAVRSRFYCFLQSNKELLFHPSRKENRTYVEKKFKQTSITREPVDCSILPTN
jgi:hypothetical protein